MTDHSDKNTVPTLPPATQGTVRAEGLREPSARLNNTSGSDDIAMATYGLRLIVDDYSEPAPAKRPMVEGAVGDGIYILPDVVTRDSVTPSQCSAEVQRQRDEHPPMNWPAVAACVIALVIASLIGASIIAKGIANLSHFNATYGDHL